MVLEDKPQSQHCVCVTSSLRVYLRCFNFFFTLLGLGLVGLSIYVYVGGPSPFAHVLLGISLFILSVGGLGLWSVGGKYNCPVRLYTVLLVLLFLFESAFVLCALFFQSKLEELFDRLGDQQSTYDRIADFVSSNVWAFKITLILVFFIQVVTLAIVIFCRRQVSLTETELEEISYESRPSRTQSRYSELPTTPATPKTDAKRAELNSKYGGLWKKTGE